MRAELPRCLAADFATVSKPAPAEGFNAAAAISGSSSAFSWSLSFSAETFSSAVAAETSHE